MIRQIVVAVDDGSKQPAARDCSVECAGELARRTGAAVTMVHVHRAWQAPTEIESLTPYRLEGVLEGAYVAGREEETDTAPRLRAVEERLGRGWDVSIRPSERAAVPSVLPGVVRTLGADLVIARFGERPCAGLTLANLPENGVRRLGVPALLLPPGTCPLLHDLNHVLVALDGSATAEEILAPTLAMIDPASATLHLLAVVVPRRRLGLRRASAPDDATASNGANGATEANEASAPHGASGATGAPGPLTTRKAAEKYLRQVAARPELKGLTVNKRVREGVDPAEAILAEARKTSAGLIAMVTGGRTGLARLLAGSVARRVLKGLDRPLLLKQAAGARRPLRRQGGTSEPEASAAQEA